MTMRMTFIMRDGYSVSIVQRVDGKTAGLNVSNENPHD